MPDYIEVQQRKRVKIKKKHRPGYGRKFGFTWGKGAIFSIEQRDEAEEYAAALDVPSRVMLCINVYESDPYATEAWERRQTS